MASLTTVRVTEGALVIGVRELSSPVSDTLLVANAVHFRFMNCGAFADSTVYCTLVMGLPWRVLCRGFRLADKQFNCCSLE
jgi:hypothetical protein